MNTRDEELVRYAIDAADIKQQNEAWEAFNRITSELAEAEQDAARLDWLDQWITDNSSGFEIYPIGPDKEYGNDGNTVVNVQGWNLADKFFPVKTLREAIDAAMASETVSGGEG